MPTTGHPGSAKCPSFKSAVHSWVLASVAYIRHRNLPPTAWSFERWGKSPTTNALVRHLDTRCSWGLPLHNLSAPGAAEYQACETAATANPTIASHLGALVGDPTGMSILTLDQILHNIFSLSVLPTPPIRIDEQRFETAYNLIEAHLFEDTYTSIHVAPIYGVKEAPPRLKLADHLSIEELSEDVINRLIGVGIISPTGFARAAILNPPTHAIVFRESSAKLVIKQSDFKEYSAKPKKPRNDSEPLIERALASLRLFRSGQVGVLGRITYSECPLSGVMSYTAPRPPQRHYQNEYELRQQDEGLLSQLHHNLSRRGVQRSAGLQMAIRRFGYAMDRTRPEDKLVDLMIGGESLFLSDIGGDHSELSYRLSMRAAKFIKGSALSERDLYKLFKAAYQGRSKIVHGSTPVEMELPDRTKVSIEGFVNVFQEHVRDAIRTAIDLTPSRQAFDGKWDDLFFAKA